MQPESHTSAGFINAFRRLLPLEQMQAILDKWGPVKRCPAKVRAANIVEALVFQVLRGSGTLCESLFVLHREKLSPSSMSERRQNLSGKVFSTIMEAVLGVKAREKEHPEAFYRGMRLVAIDGTQFSVTNTPQILHKLSKAATRRMKAAFAKISVAVLVELGVHNPLAAEIGTAGESEMVLAKRLLSRLPGWCLLLGDRYYGAASFLLEFLLSLKEAGTSYLVRVRSTMKPRVIAHLGDGSVLVEVKTSKGQPNLMMREIRGRVRRGQGPWVDLRFWTNLIDPKEYPATELLALYARRWEQEMMYREIKVDMRQSPLLNSHTVETAAQEICALLIAHALVAQGRLDAAQAGTAEVLRISFGKTLHGLRALWAIVAVGEGILSADQTAALTARLLSFLAETLLPKRRARSCPRKVRQPVSSWPRLTETLSSIGGNEYELTPAFA